MVSSKKKSTVMSPHPMSNEKTQPIQWTERPTGALVAVNSLWPLATTYLVFHYCFMVLCCCSLLFRGITLLLEGTSLLLAIVA
jgi:hypothetical protein